MEDTGMNVMSIEMDFNICETDHCLCFMLGDNGTFKEISPLGSPWKSESFAGSKNITVKAIHLGVEKAMLMRAQLAEAGEGIKLRMVVKLRDDIEK